MDGCIAPCEDTHFMFIMKWNMDRCVAPCEDTHFMFILKWNMDRCIAPCEDTHFMFIMKWNMDRCIALSILNAYHKQMLLVSFMTRPLYPRGNTH